MTICGLDFGTSNSTIGVQLNDQHTMVPLEQDDANQWQTTLPSALFFGFEDDEISFGRNAIARYTTGEQGRLLRSMKSILGGSFMGDKTRVKNNLYSFDEIIAFFVGSLKTQAEQFAKNNAADFTSLQSVVMGRPVYFNDTDPLLDQAAEDHLADIARLAGFIDVSFQFEPIAAAMDYERQVRKEELALIVDIGGGTSDFTLVRLSPERHGKHDRQRDFLGNHGVHLGGTDFDRELSVSAVMPEFGMGMPLKDKPGLNMPNAYYFDLATWHKIHLLYDRKVLLELDHLAPVVSDKNKLKKLTALLKLRKGHQLAGQIERAKIALADKQETTIDLRSLFIESADIDIDNCTLSQAQLQTCLQRDINKIFITLQETLNQAGLTHQHIDTVFTTGGSTALPMIQACIDAAFPNARQVTGDLYTSVGAGLLMEAQLRYA